MEDLKLIKEKLSKLQSLVDEQLESEIIDITSIKNKFDKISDLINGLKQECGDCTKDVLSVAEPSFTFQEYTYCRVHSKYCCHKECSNQRRTGCGCGYCWDHC